MLFGKELRCSADAMSGKFNPFTGDPLRPYTVPYWSNPPFLPEHDYVTFGSLLS